MTEGKLLRGGLRQETGTPEKMSAFFTELAQRGTQSGDALHSRLGALGQTRLYYKLGEYAPCTHSEPGIRPKGLAVVVEKLFQEALQRHRRSY